MGRCLTVNIPRAYVRKADGERRRAWFIQNKYIPLVNKFRIPDTLCIFHKATHFAGLLSHTLSADGMRIYIASYSNEGSYMVPAEHGNLLTLIYAPTTIIDSTHFDKGEYYTLPPGSPFQLISKRLANEWILNYQTTKLPFLTEIMEFPETIPDTKSLLYERSIVKGIIDEIDCEEATGVRIYFSSFADVEKTPNDQFVKRLIVQFVLTENINGTERDFYIDERPDFKFREQEPPFLDTGSPCPPASCGGDLLPQDEGLL